MYSRRIFPPLLYKFLKAQLKVDGYEEWYFIVWFMAATGARVSELLHIKAEHIKVGFKKFIISIADYIFQEVLLLYFYELHF